MSTSLAPRRVEMWRRWRLVVVVLILSLFENHVSAFDIISTLRLRKCFCDKFQAWDGTKCLDNIPTALPIYNHTFDGPQKHVIDVQRYAKGYNTSLFENVTVQDIHCSKGLYRSTLSGDILLLPDGRLLRLNTNTALPAESFCVLHLWKNGIMSFDAHVCLRPPAVPRCCPMDHLLGRDGSCYSKKTLKAPPILIGEHEMDWNSLDGDMIPQTCEEHEYHHYVHLREDGGQLRDTHPTATLNWSPPVWTASLTYATKYCVAMQEGEAGELEFVAQICFKDYSKYHEKQCGAAACVRKCCPENALLYHRVCVDAFSEEEKWRPSQIPNQTINKEWKIVTGEPGCPSLPHQEPMHLLPNGFLQLAADIPAVPPSQYCVDNLLDAEENIDNIALICSLPANTECLWRDKLIKVLMGVSCVFLVVTLGVYLGVAELRDQMYGRCLISLVAAMLTAYIGLMIDARYILEAECYAKAFIVHLSSLAMFFWLNVMCFDMWKILRGSTRQHHSLGVFLWYSVYAWGCSLVISIVTLALDVAPPTANLILPEYYDGACWFNENAAYWLYFSGFILVLVVINVGFFIHVAITLYKKIKQRSEFFEAGGNQTNKTTKTKQRVWLFAKLFVVMGVLWITDVLSAVGHRKTCTYWVLSDIINSLQGVFIFIVAVCNKDNLKKVKQLLLGVFRSLCVKASASSNPPSTSAARALTRETFLPMTVRQQ
ncbi:probable G-protein coupled receptor Mth-like 3 isoform X2 [Eriocheir sinensis]|uniref:probable G-protein coupled receptor Mth-like 3 isoform X2 n=1 Tax=Eriocheir sinensis TaxID=95602 RepID=UPI0021C9F4F2|nr:probable G-protein coupled receptor Mth-like 3 isoform X2 [Eriocheir sinensis]